MSGGSPGVSFRIAPRTLRYLGIGVLALTVVNTVNALLGMPYWTITRFVHLGRDTNIAAWYSSLLLALGGLAALECFHTARRMRLARASAFLGAAGLLFLMSCDEIARFHEVLGGLLVDHSRIAGKAYAAHTGWVWVGGPVILAIFGACWIALRPLLSLAPGSGRRLGLGFGLVILGGVILEASVNWLNHDHLQALWDAETIVEETLEMLGTILVASAFVNWRRALAGPDEPALGSGLPDGGPDARAPFPSATSPSPSESSVVSNGAAHAKRSGAGATAGEPNPSGAPVAPRRAPRTGR